MRLLSSVVWSEGMYLGPHHFQAQNRYFEDCLTFAARSLWHSAYGFTGYAINAEALRGGIIEVRHAQGILPDGMTFDIPDCDAAPAPRAIADSFPPTRDFLIASLAIPCRKADAQNVALELTPGADVRLQAQATNTSDASVYYRDALNRHCPRSCLDPSN